MSNTTDKARELSNAYQREWCRKNRDKVKQYKRNYWEKKARELEQLEGKGLNEDGE